MDLKNNHTEQDDNLGKILKKLPKVDASPDFDARLQRKLTEQPTSKRGWSLFDSFIFSQRVPVFVSSALALIAVSVISYYLFVDNKSKSNIPEQHGVISEPQQSIASAQKEPDVTVNEAFKTEGKLNSKVSEDKVSKSINNRGAVSNKPAGRMEMNVSKKKESPQLDAEPADQRSKDLLQESKEETVQPMMEMNASSPSTVPQTHELQLVQPTSEEQQQAVQQKMQIAPELDVRGKSIQEKSSGAPSIETLIQKAAPVDPRLLRGGRSGVRNAMSAFSTSNDTSKADSLRRDSLKAIEKQAKKRKP